MQLRLVRALLAAGVLSVGMMFSMPRPAGADTVALSGPEAQFLSDINNLRAQHGLQPVVPDAQLTSVARSWTTQMANAGGISHNPSLASEVSEYWLKLGENVGYGPDVQTLFTAFVNSPHHYANLVDPSYNRIGIGVVVVNGTMYTTHDFMDLGAPAPAAPAYVPPAPASVSPAPRPAPSPAPVARVAVAASPAPPVPASAPSAPSTASTAAPTSPAPSANGAATPSAAASQVVAVQLEELRSLDSAA